MIKRKASFLALLAMAAAALPAIWMGPASATGTSNGGVVHFTQVDNTLSGHTGQVTLTGALADYGQDNEAGGSGNINVFTFPPGKFFSRSFAVDTSKFGSGGPQLTVYPNCSFTQVLSGQNLPIVAGSGTGIYTGIKGSLDVTAIYSGVVGRLPDGKCDVRQVGGTPRGLLFATGTGNISLSR
jgi:hypothetical protein